MFHTAKIQLLMIVLVVIISNGTFAADYQGPNAVVPSKDGTTLYVLNHDAAEIAVVSTETNAIAKTISVPQNPNGMVLSGSGKVLAVTCGEEFGSVVVVNVADGKILKETKAGHTPCSPVFTPDGKKLYICNRFDANVSEFEVPSLKLLKTINVIREPVSAAITPDGKTLFVNNFLPNDPADSFNVAAEVSAIDTATGEVNNIRLPNGSSSLHSVCVSPDGKYAYSVGILARYAIPTTQIERGWMNTNALNIIDVASKSWVNTVLLDDVDLGAANPWAITTSADGKKIFVAVAGTHELCVINAEAMLSKLLALPKTIEEAKAAGTYDTRGTYSSSTTGDVQNDLAFLVSMKKRIKLPGKAPRSIAIVGDHVYLGMYFSDTIVNVELNAPGKPKTMEIALGPKPELTPARLGEQVWHDATHCFQTWQSCSSCHPDARMDALNWDLLNDGMGNPKNAKSMVQAYGRGPAMWQGVRPTTLIAIRTGFRYIQFSVPDEKLCTAVEEFFKTLQPMKSPHLVNGELSESAKQGKLLFESDKIGCAKCHPAPNFTDSKGHDVESRGQYDRTDIFITPPLAETWRTAPYLHDGRYVNMKDLFQVGKHGSTMGDIEEMTDQEISDLTEYVLSL